MHVVATEFESVPETVVLAPKEKNRKHLTNDK